MNDPKEIFDEIESKSQEFTTYGDHLVMQISRDDFLALKRKYCDADWTGYEDYDEVDNNKSRKGFPYRKGRK